METPSDQTASNPTGGTPAPATANAASPPLLSAKYLNDKLEEAELLMGYAAQAGIKVDGQVRDDVLKARAASDSGGITEPVAANLLTALTTLAVNVRPVTVMSLRAWANPDVQSQKEIPYLAPIAIVIGIVIVIFSLLTFVSKSISDKITADVDTANTLVAKLRVELGPASASTNPPAALSASAISNAATTAADEVWFGPGGIPAGLSDKDVINDLQLFAATMRQIDGYTRQLKRCLLDFDSRTNQSSLELTPGLNVRLAQELTDKVAAYQQVRTFADQVVEKVTVYYGAIGISILPLLYALLGAVAYLLRAYEEEVKNRTLNISGNISARLLIAGIGGLVVGQFNNVTQGINVTPFAVAFLVGYAVDVFFAFLENVLLTFVKRSSGNP
jgi:hypothetical protein